MKSIIRKAGLLLSTATLVLAQPLGTAQAQEKRIVAVSIPAATHGWTGGVVYHAEQAEKEVEAAFPNVDVVLSTASSATAQVSALEDLSATRKLDALVILPFTSEELTGPVEQIKKNGTFISVVDRGLTDPTIQDLYVAGDNIAVGANTARWLSDKLGGEGEIVVLRGIPTVIDDETHQRLLGRHRQDEHQDPRYPIRQLEPGRSLQAHAGLSCKVPEDRRRLGQR